MHGKTQQTGGAYEGRTVKTGREEVLDFLVQAYENFQDEVTVLTGRGNHVNPNGQKGVLYSAFAKEWMQDETLTSIVKKYYSVAGDGGYKIVLIKPEKLNLTVINFVENLPLIKQTITDMVQKGKTRLFLQIDFKGNPFIRNPEFELMKHLTQNLMTHEPNLFRTIYPLSFEAESERLRIIFNKIHPRAPHMLSLGNYLGTSIIEGNIGSLPH